MNQKNAAPEGANRDKDWQKTQYANLIRYVPSGTYYARIRVVGKLIRKSLKTDVLTVAKLRLADLEKNERESVESRDSASKGSHDVWRLRGDLQNANRNQQSIEAVRQTLPPRGPRQHWQILARN